MPTRTARTAWNGNLLEGSGQVELTSSGVGTYEVSFPKRAADDADGTTSPEELIAAAHSACYAMALSNEIAQAGGTPQALDVQADVTLGPDPAGGFRITGIKLTVRAEVDGLDEAGFAKAAQGAKEGCPVSKALAAVDITLDAALESWTGPATRAPASGRRRSPPARGRPRRCFPGERSALPGPASSARREGSAHSGPPRASSTAGPRAADFPGPHHAVPPPRCSAAGNGRIAAVSVEHRPVTVGSGPGRCLPRGCPTLSGQSRRIPAGSRIIRPGGTCGEISRGAR